MQGILTHREESTHIIKRRGIDQSFRILVMWHDSLYRASTEVQSHIKVSISYLTLGRTVVLHNTLLCIMDGYINLSCFVTRCLQQHLRKEKQQSTAPTRWRLNDIFYHKTTFINCFSTWMVNEKNKNDEQLQLVES